MHAQLRTTVRLDESLLEEAKAQAARQKKTLTSLIEEGLRLVIARSRTTAPRKKVVLPVSHSGGGPMPGVDINNSADLMDILEGRL
jgi:hypothetical protein